jgi:hypothetical protein
MIVLRVKGICAAGGIQVGALLLASALAGCSGNGLLGAPRPAAQTAPTPQEAEAPPAAPPPVDLAGRWHLTAAAGGACFMNFGDVPATPNAVKGTIAPEGGCPGNFFTSRKWSYDDGVLNIRDFKNQPLAQLSYAGDHFQGHDTSGGPLTLSR